MPLCWYHAHSTYFKYMAVVLPQIKMIFHLTSILNSLLTENNWGRNNTQAGLCILCENQLHKGIVLYSTNLRTASKYFVKTLWDKHISKLPAHLETLEKSSTENLFLTYFWYRCPCTDMAYLVSSQIHKNLKLTQETVLGHVVVFYIIRKTHIASMLPALQQ